MSCCEIPPLRTIGRKRLPIMSLAIVYNTCTLFGTRERCGVNRVFHNFFQFDVHVAPNHVMRFTEDGDLTKSPKSVQGFLDFLENNLLCRCREAITCLSRRGVEETAPNAEVVQVVAALNDLKRCLLADTLWHGRVGAEFTAGVWDNTVDLDGSGVCCAVPRRCSSSPRVDTSRHCRSHVLRSCTVDLGSAWVSPRIGFGIAPTRRNA